MAEWISVKDGIFPKRYKPVLVTDGVEVGIAALQTDTLLYYEWEFLLTDLDWCMCSDGNIDPEDEDYPITHWMPLPEPPKEDE